MTSPCVPFRYQSFYSYLHHDCSVTYLPEFPRIIHYGDVIMGAMASRITSLTIVCTTVYSGTDRRKHQSSASLAFVRGIHRGPVNSPHKRSVTRRMSPFDDVIMINKTTQLRASPCNMAKERLRQLEAISETVVMTTIQHSRFVGLQRVTLVTLLAPILRVPYMT